MKGNHLQDNDKRNLNTNVADPWIAFVVSEQMLATKILKSIHQTLVAMHAAAKDITSIGKDDLTLMKIICENQVPLKWRKYWSGPRLLTDYLKAVVSRCVEANNRYNTGKSVDFCNKIDFTKVFNVESFLAALKLRNARYTTSNTKKVCELTNLL